MGGNRPLVFYGAISLDGYLARENDALDWLLETEFGDSTGYAEFYATVDTLLMGRKTYDQIEILSPNRWSYEGKPCYVFSRSRSGLNEHVEFVNDDIVEFTRDLKTKQGGRIWIVGGGEILQPLVQSQLVDEFIIQYAPAIIGRGIPLFIPGELDMRLKLQNIRRFEQLAELHYVVESGYA